MFRLRANFKKTNIARFGREQMKKGQLRLRGGGTGANDGKIMEMLMTHLIAEILHKFNGGKLVL